MNDEDTEGEDKKRTDNNILSVTHIQNSKSKRRFSPLDEIGQRVLIALKMGVVRCQHTEGN